MRVAEIYSSVQGEGLFTGTESVFVRASGCNLRCNFCDTPFASWRPEGDDLSVDQIVESVLARPEQHVVLTGGEPMLFAELLPITRRLHEAGRHLTVETAGTLYLPVTCDLMSISPKLSNSTPSPETEPQWSARHERVRMAPDVIGRLTAEYDYRLKFVIGAPQDAEEVATYLEHHPFVDRSRVMMMPEGTHLPQLNATAVWLEPYCSTHGLAFCPRKQIEWFGFVRGT